MKLFLLFFIVLIGTEAAACPFCNTNTARQIRSSLLGADLLFNIGITILPFLLFAAITFFIYHGGLPARPKQPANPINKPLHES